MGLKRDGLNDLMKSENTYVIEKFALAEALYVIVL